MMDCDPPCHSDAEADTTAPATRGGPALDLSAWLAGRRQSTSRPQPTAAPSPSTDLARRAARYLDGLPGAVAGQKGHDRTFHAACVLLKGFGLSIEAARPLLKDWNRRCEPPWSDRDLEHKLLSADAASDDRPRGYLDAGRRRKGTPAKTVNSLPIVTTHPPDSPGPDAADVAEKGQETNPHRLARLFLKERFQHADDVSLRFWREQFHEWDGSVYRVVATAEVRSQLTQTLAAEFERLHQEAIREWTPGSGKGQSAAAPRPIAVTCRLVSDVLQAVTGLVLIRVTQAARQPAWIGGEPSAWPGEEILPARNVLVHLDSFAQQAACTRAATPKFFNAFALDYDFVPTAMEPVEWLAFLREVWGKDPESVACLQEWFGYLLTPDTRQQKILMMVGPKRSGRGTVARVLKALVGAGNVVNPTLAMLARPFGLAPLIDKPVAVFPDARLSSRPDNAAIVESLLSISGEDDQTIDRKHLPAWTGRLPTRFVLISNELPRLKDASGALASRLILLRFKQSFYGREDTGLLDRLSRELPGILLWAIEGWQRLRQRGHFLQPISGQELLEAMEDLGSPISTFLREHCVIGPEESVPVAAIYECWRSWCQEQGRDLIGDEPSFGRDLRAAVPELSKTRVRHGGGRAAYYRGIRLRTELDADG